jgi:hypothetical protein
MWEAMLAIANITIKRGHRAYRYLPGFPALQLVACSLQLSSQPLPFGLPGFAINYSLLTIN